MSAAWLTTGNADTHKECNINALQCKYHGKNSENAKNDHYHRAPILSYSNCYSIMFNVTYKN
jgi:hypothetical protein